jgi:hypothetical protein
MNICVNSKSEDRDLTIPKPKSMASLHRRKFDAFLNAVRWGAIASADVRSLQSPFRRGITIEDYQLDPLVRAVQMPHANYAWRHRPRGHNVLMVGS